MPGRHHIGTTAGTAGVLLAIATAASTASHRHEGTRWHPICQEQACPACRAVHATGQPTPPPALAAALPAADPPGPFATAAPASPERPPPVARGPPAAIP